MPSLEGPDIRKLILILWVVALASACAAERVSILDEELALYRSEHERYRRDELEELYRSEQARSDELTTLILGLRRAIEDKTRELGELRARHALIEAQLVREQAAGAGGAPETPGK